MAGLLGHLVTGANRGVAAYLTGTQQGQQDAAERARREQAALIQQAALALQRRQADEATRQHAEQQSRTTALDALNGILPGTAPVVEAPRMLQTPLGGIVDRLPTPENDPTRYQQLGDRYIDRTQTPEARQERQFERTSAAQQAAAQRAELVRTALAKQQADASDARLDKTIAAGDRRSAAQIAAAANRPRGYQPQSMDEAVEFARRKATGAKGATLKPVPNAAMKTMIENTKSLGTIDDAIARATSTPGAFGPTNALGGAWVKDQLGSSSPDERAARAAAADIGSLIVHDRSGAAVTVSELPRLAPFIPNPSDNAETVLIKLKRLREAIQQEHDLYVDNYGPDQGFQAPNLRAQRGETNNVTPQQPAGSNRPPLSSFRRSPP